MGERGASLIELIIVVGMVSVTLFLAGEGFVTAAARQQGRTVTTELAAELRSARHFAMTQRKPVRVVFQMEKSAIRTELVQGVGSLVREYHFSQRQVMVESISNGSTVVFYPSGRTASPTTITLRGPRLERWQLTVSFTGRVSVVRKQ
jgi:type IV fimbrial biogenesis protein FimT